MRAQPIEFVRDIGHGAAHALALSNNIGTSISLSTNVATGSNTFTTLAPITITCGVVDITAGAANGVFGVTLTLAPGWTFVGGVAPAITYAWGGGPTGDAIGTIASATSITVDILASCDHGDVITLTGVQVKPLTSASASMTIVADIATADVTAATITAVAVPPPPPPPPSDGSLFDPEPVFVPPVRVVQVVPPPVIVVAPVAVPTPVVVAPVVVAPIVAATPEPAPVIPAIQVPTAPRPAATGSGGIAGDRSSGVPFGPTALLLIGVATCAVVARRLVRGRANQ